MAHCFKEAPPGCDAGWLLNFEDVWKVYVLLPVIACWQLYWMVTYAHRVNNTSI